MVAFRMLLGNWLVTSESYISERIFCWLFPHITHSLDLWNCFHSKSPPALLWIWCFPYRLHSICHLYEIWHHRGRLSAQSLWFFWAPDSLCSSCPFDHPYSVLYFLLNVGVTWVLLSLLTIFSAKNPLHGWSILTVSYIAITNCHPLHGLQ